MGNYIAKVYANLILKKKKTIQEVPEELRQEVQSLLEQNNA